MIALHGMKIVSVILICAGVAVALHQILAYHIWEWEQMLSVIHHEGIALVTVIVGLLLWVMAPKQKQEHNP